MTHKYLRADDFFVNPTKCNISQEVREKLEKERRQIDLGLLRRLEDWSFLANKIVGAED